ncbi:hypothetical protein Airi01_023580 [Actinoallomurus iriomotensis]|uniref:Uncharacterized protein n=2 Tax=Actinoallomurus iriomotensis TaxID=478107 RepID=A0A9W6VPZ4_9ACTN|nr:hypothetical protein Airi01_023580 [Actinoallomurus iriomotensis]
MVCLRPLLDELGIRLANDGGEMTNETERRFHLAMVEIYQTAKRELGYNAKRFIQMVSDQGGLATARQLLWSDQISDGFETLRQHGRLDLSVGAHVLKEEFAELFTDEDRRRARDRLAPFR